MTTLEMKIKEMLEKQSGKKLQEATLGVDEMEAATHSTAQTGLPVGGQTAGDVAPIPAPGSVQPEVEELDPDAPGLTAAAKAVQTAPLQAVGNPLEVVVPSMAEDVSMLFAGQELTEEFKGKATSLFEAAVTARSNFIVDGMKTKLQEEADNRIEEIKQTLAEQVDSYMTYAVEDWAKQNAVAINQGLRSEITEGFMKGLKNLFVESMLNVPEDEVDVIAQLTEANDAIKAEHNEAIEKLLESKAEAAANEKQLLEKIETMEKSQIIESVSKGLTALEAEKLKTLVEGVEFSSKELFVEKVTLIKNTHFTQSKGSSSSILEESKQVETQTPSTINAYVQALKSLSR